MYKEKPERRLNKMRIKKYIRKLYKIAMMLMAFIGIITHAQYGHSIEQQRDRHEVVINGTTLSAEQISEFQAIYGIDPVPGNYWYDSRSGLYGVIGQPAYGALYAGHDLGELRRNASRGDTNVILNGRELPLSEWAAFSQILGYWIQPGSYWLDQYGNAGYEGSPVPIVNLYTAAQQNSYGSAGGGGSGGGDNFWSSRFSAGNYDSDNQRGYVSVPGHGPVGYGF